MTEEELEFNRMCSDLIGLKIEDNFINNTYEVESFFPLLGYSRPIRELEFHYNWSWIMEVVEAIEKLNKIVIIDGNKCTITPIDSSYIFCKNKSKKEAVVQAINQFLIWYNKNK